MPSEIVDEESSGETEVIEGGGARLYCKASGYPTPTIYWRKEVVGQGGYIVATRIYLGRLKKNVIKLN